MWDFPQLFASDLAQLRNLKELRIVTPDVVAFPCGFKAAERTLICSWLTGSEDVTTWAERSNHPSLRFIGISYGFTTNTNGYISHWIKHHELWERPAHLPPPIPAGLVP